MIAVIPASCAIWAQSPEWEECIGCSTAPCREKPNCPLISSAWGAGHLYCWFVRRPFAIKFFSFTNAWHLIEVFANELANSRSSFSASVVLRAPASSSRIVRCVGILYEYAVEYAFVVFFTGVETLFFVAKKKCGFFLPFSVVNALHRSRCYIISKKKVRLFF